MKDGRISVISEMVRKGDRVADIGTDHAYLAIELVKNGISPFVLACDIAEGPLNNARSNIEKSGVHNIELRQGNGLSPVRENEVDSVVIAGMGGDLISDIISAASWLRDSRYEIILQPMSSVDELRKFLCENGFLIKKEKAVISSGRVYSIMKVGFSGTVLPVDPYFYAVGKLTENIGEEEITYFRRVYRIMTEKKNSLKNVPSKTEQYEELCTVTEKLEKLLNGG